MALLPKLIEINARNLWRACRIRRRKASCCFQNGATTKTYRNKCKKPERDGAHVELDGGKLVAASKMAATTKTYRNKCKKPERDGDM